MTEGNLSDKMFNDFIRFIDGDKDEIIKDFCDKIVKEEIGDLSLNEYVRFRFWKHSMNNELRNFYKSYILETNDIGSFDVFCEMSWLCLDQIVNDGNEILKEMAEFIDKVKFKDFSILNKMPEA